MHISGHVRRRYGPHVGVLKSITKAETVITPAGLLHV